MPVYNSEVYLNEAIESILAQSYRNFELILVNDGSTDRSGSICDDYARRDSRVQVIHKKNGGISDARNSGLIIAKGDYVLFADNDDLFKNTLLEDNLKIAKEHNADIVKFGVKYVEINSNIEKEIEIRNLPRLVLNKDEIRLHYLKLRKNNIFVYVWDSLIKRNILNDNKIIFSSEFKLGGEDIDFNFKVFEYIESLIINPGQYYTHFKRFNHSTVCKFSPAKLKPFLLNATSENNFIENIKTDKDESLLVYLVTSYVIQLSYTLSHIDELSFEDKIKYLSDNNIFKIFGSRFKITSFIKALFTQPKRAIIYWLYHFKFYKLIINICS
jgi:glycosyltransferase involved in cell wall biosynthesis